MRELFKTTLLLAAALLAVTTPATARSWRINNNANRKAHFSDINEAMNSNEVHDGDTLYLDPGSVNNEQTVSKRVTIIGTGYFMNSSVPTARMTGGSLYLKAEGTKIEGVDLGAGNNYIRIYAKNITIERCRLSRIVWNDNGENLIVRQCWLGSIYGNGKQDSRTIGTLIENCFITGEYSETPNTVYYLYKATLRNNYICRNGGDGVVAALYSCTLINNILINYGTKNKVLNGPSPTTDCVINHNIMSCDEDTYTSCPDNVCLGTTDISSIFTLEGDNDLRYQLREDSPAKGAAADGGDCGPSGGENPYVCSGFPFGMPHLVSGSVSTTPQDRQVSITQQVTLQNK